MRARSLRAMAFGLTAAGLFGGAFWLWQDGWYGRQWNNAVTWGYGLTGKAGLEVVDLLVEGRDRSLRSRILEALEVRRGTPILQLDPNTARERLKALPWVEDATVERRLPHTVYVRLIERQPLALWQQGGRLAVIDRAGKVVPEAEPRRFAMLPLVVGPDAPQHAAEIISVLHSEPGLMTKVTAAVRVGGRRWSIQLKGGVDVHLPEGGLAGAWAQLAKIEREHGILDRDVVVIDLRVPDRLVVRTAPGAEVTGRAKGENT
jgi:cell division protein FtsQ